MSGTRAGPGVAFERSGVLLDRVRAVLERGPVPTLVLASRALGVTGNPDIAARAVWTLLADDPRFVVDADGVWSLRRALPPPPRALWEEEWVVIDVETTGGSPKSGHRVTEVAAVRVVGDEIRETFSTLINPRRPIPRQITALTGIDDAMVATAPGFEEVVPQLAGILEGRVFVAHNAPFDWRFLSAETERATGRVPAGRQLCTVRLARKLLPQLPSRSLDALAHYFGLENDARHRAKGDAVATARLLLRLLDMLDERGIDDWNQLDVWLRRRSARRKRTASPRSMDSA